MKNGVVRSRGPAYIGHDGLAYIKASLYDSTNALVEWEIEFLLDTGSNVSGIDRQSIRGGKFSLDSIQALETPAGDHEYIVISGAKIEFDVKAKDGSISPVTSNLPMAVLPQNLIGVDQLKVLKIRFTIDPAGGNAVLEST